MAGVMIPLVSRLYSLFLANCNGQCSHLDTVGSIVTLHLEKKV